MTNEEATERLRALAQEADAQPGQHCEAATRAAAAERETRGAVLDAVLPGLRASYTPESHYIPQDDAARKAAPMFRGMLGYFPAALFELAAHSQDSDRKHNPGNPAGPNWARGVSTDDEDCIIRHLVDAGPRRSKLDRYVPPPAGSTALDARRYHLRALLWRAAALLQEDCEETGALPGVSCKLPTEPRDTEPCPPPTESD